VCILRFNHQTWRANFLCTDLYCIVSNVTHGTDALGEVNVRLESDGRIVNGQGADTDIIIASAKAYVNESVHFAFQSPNMACKFFVY
jgi:hypothetical protein